MAVPVITADKKIDCEHLLGTFLDESHYDTVIDSDCDFYAPGLFGEENGESNILFKFRKGVFTDEEQIGAYEGLVQAATASQNRGLAAGPRGEKNINRDWVSSWQQDVLDVLIGGSIGLDGIDQIPPLIEKKSQYKADTSRGNVWLRSKIVEKGGEYDGFFEKWLNSVLPLSVTQRRVAAMTYAKECISKTTYANQVNSGIAGYFDRYPRYPYGRSCAYNQDDPWTFAKSFPYLRKLDALFAEHLPERYQAQLECAKSLDPMFLVGGDTVFTTLTINRTFRTAAHRDAGDLNRGFSNLNVISTKGNFKGGYLVLPEFRVAVNIRPGDLLLINNHEGMHGNTEIEPLNEGEEVDRLSLVAYFREGMLELGSWDYETTRRDFVESRRLDESHPEWRPGWNGVSASMFESEEWIDFLEKTGKTRFLKEYHPKLRRAKSFSLFD